MDLTKFADQLMDDTYEISEKDIRLMEVYTKLYANPHSSIGKIREVFDDVSIEELKSIYKDINNAPYNNYDEFECGNVGDPVSASIHVQVAWNVSGAESYWKKLKNEKKRFF